MENYNLGHVPNLSERLQKLNTPSTWSLQTELNFTWVANYTHTANIACRKQGDLWFEMHVRMQGHIHLTNEYGRTLNYNYWGVAIDDPATAFTIIPYALATMGGYDYVILSTDFTILCLAQGVMVDTYYNFTPIYAPDGETPAGYANTYEPIQI